MKGKNRVGNRGFGLSTDISRCYSESIVIKVSDIITYIMKIMGFHFKKIGSSSLRDIQKSAEGIIKNKVALR